MTQIIDVSGQTPLSAYEERVELTLAVQELRSEASRIAPAFGGRRLWMVNSTPQGGGVAEMLPQMISLLTELGLETKWAVLEADQPEFFDLTKRIHNLIHGVGDPRLTTEDRAVFETVARANAAVLKTHLRSGDILIVHDPQPLPLGPFVKEHLALTSFWRCHIGLDHRCEQTRAAWRFLEPYATSYDHAIFSVPEYIPSYLAGRASIIHPAIDPLSYKNRDLPIHRLVGVLTNGALVREPSPVLTPRFEHVAKRLGPDGNWLSACESDEIGLLSRPIVTQISRWDRLKGFPELMKAFVSLKSSISGNRDLPPLHRRRLELARLVLAGPEPTSVQDDPEALGVLDELRTEYLDLPRSMQADIAIIALPMHSRKENALLVNALQRCSTVIVQNSIREGFGLTVSEALWKGIPVVGSLAVGIRRQIRDRLDGCLVDGTDVQELAMALDRTLADPALRQSFSLNGRKRVYEEFLVLTQIRHWLEVLADHAA